jgi:ribosomal protein S18 acetylase RimI-like enzyme
MAIRSAATSAPVPDRPPAGAASPQRKPTMSSTPNGLHIRKASPIDTDALFDICLRTADAGGDATALYSEPHLPGYIWVAPYAVLEPDFAFVLADAEEAPLGYVVGTPDSHGFANRLEREWWPHVRHKIAGLVPRTPADEISLAHIASPLSEDDEWLLTEYPAHLHINLLPAAQSGGWGRRLIEAELQELRAHASPGVHLGVSPKNVRAQGFYRHVGFTDISRNGQVLFSMRLR